MGEDDYLLRSNLSNSFSALTVSGRFNHYNASNNQPNRKPIKEDDILQQIEEQETEILQLRKHLAEYTVKEAQIQNEKHVLEKRIASMHKAFDQQQQDLFESTSNARSYRQEITEENIRLGYALGIAEEERSIFISSLAPLLSDLSLHPPSLDAYSIISNLRILFKHNKERLAIADEKLRNPQYQPLTLHPHRRDDSSSHSPWTHTNTHSHSNFSPSQEPVHIERQTKEQQEEDEEEEEEVVNSHYLPSILEEPSSSSQLEADDDSEDDNFSDENEEQDLNKPLPTIEGLQILGESFPGNEIQASGYSRNGTTHCGFEWVRHLQDGSVNYIEGAKQPTYTVTADDVDTYLAVEVQPLDNKQRKGELVKCFANDNKKITCHPDMLREIEKIFNLGHANFKLLIWKESSDTWENGMLEIKKSGYVIKINNGSVVVDEKYAANMVVSLPGEMPLEFSILSSSDVEHYLRVDDNLNDVSCSRDTIVLTMRLFIKRAVDRKLGKKKRRGLFFK
ncbi:uncharacterized protein LOC111920696 [Lactuca sativa]|uniref:Uncharacterized protein n=1 Tax=Lactuca sativa TaxID=4236 RepID=A0A9R1VJJ6_LACSA|nr:uncharacterized protein LOC111920696 [Lactuca sativa]KAJ0206208.1 hypothetical protein LSAT_V11C500260710 [Lactuca sativa]